MADIKNKDKFLLDAYSGGGGFLDGDYLVAYSRETDDKFSRRKKIAVYPNFVRKVVDSYHSHLFRFPVKRESENEIYNRFCGHAGRRGETITDIIRMAWRLAMISPCVWLIVDRPRGKAETRADDLDLMPYVALRTHSQLTKSRVDEDGRVELLVFSENRDGEKVYRRLDRDSWAISRDIDGEDIIDQGEHRLEQVPAVPLMSTEPLFPGDLEATPWSWDIAMLSLDLYNAWSELRELFRSQTFSIFTIPVRNRDEAERLKNITISTENALTYNPDGGGVPGFAAPPADPVDLYLKYIDSIINRIYEVANLEFTGGVQQSGIALSYKFQEANRTLSAMARLCEQADLQIARLVCAWMDQEWDGRITYPDDFDVTDLLQELQIAMDAVALDISPTFDKQLRKNLARDILGSDVAGDVLESIDSEIDEGSDPYRERLKDAAE